MYIINFIHRREFINLLFIKEHGNTHKKYPQIPYSVEEPKIMKAGLQ